MTVPILASITPRSAKADQRTTLSAVWMMGLETAAEIMGTRVRLADALGIDPRSLRNKLDAGRGISRADMTFAAVALEKLGNRALAHAAKLRAAAAPPAPPVITEGEKA